MNTQKLVRASAAYDLLLTAPFATPWTFAIAHGHLSALNQALGGAPLPEFGVMHMLFAGLLGSIVVVWSWLRLRDPLPRYATYDGTARFLFSAWFAWTLALGQGGLPLVWLFIVPEFAWGVVQWYAVPPLSKKGGSHASATFDRGQQC
ncbi:hypothetical protein GTP41_13045 [Pseudoduganella sp. DS3]|uniref:Uncharacterized protein n=1 Tax=Pseudoduganella guangdongensis TaxID=2692179 RepID=A0A6N9HI49_9BURK|nr:hypothetical protein [Pseudoduganella guangdongensis]MYN03029.1 hypothetical protein [Pseudoduganella guangdongensis]